MLSNFPRWKYVVLTVAIVIGLVYALPNLYGEDPAIQVIGAGNTKVDNVVETKVADILKDKDFKYKSMQLTEDQLLVRFYNTDTQLASQDVLKAALGANYSVALNLAPVTPYWLRIFGAEPMKLGLDLRGGVRFLMEVDVASNIQRRLEGSYNDLRTNLREKKIRYDSITLKPDQSIVALFNNKDDLHAASNYIHDYMPTFTFEPAENHSNGLVVRLAPTELEQIRNYTMDQTASTLRNRVNELGVAEAIIQRQGTNRIVVELPGIQDTARAKDILGKTATVDFLIEDSDVDIRQAVQGYVPPGSRIYIYNGIPILLKSRVILTGDSIVGASSQYDGQDNKPIVAVNLGGTGVNQFIDVTANNVGHRMAVIYKESHMQETLVDGVIVKKPITTEKVISYATINNALGNNFQISGLQLQESRDLALLLRAGALPATISIVEERVIGPSMGQENIDKGITSVVVGFSLIVVFMTLYYSLFGIIANIALLMNLIMLVALLSLVGATLTLPGIAGIVLTLGMAVDANVLIFERIREELRNGLSPHASIQRGFDHAFSTIIDSNLTTLIVGVILFAVGTGPVKGFAITLSLGILTSMFTSITGTRAIIELIYGKRNVQKLPIGI